nr:hypothetical protein CFP56_20964 [Quercus suber]
MAYHYIVDSSRIEPPRTYFSRAQNRSITRDLPYAQHPIFPLRRLHCVVAFVGVFLCFISTNWYDADVITFTILSLLASIFFCAADVYLWATKKAANPDEDPPWPTRRFIFGDLAMAVVLLFVFAVGFSAVASGPYGYGGPGNVVKAYAFLAALICSSFHACAFWHQLMALYKKAWLASLHLPFHEPCQRCGYTPPSPSQLNPTQEPGTQGPNIRTPLLQARRVVPYPQPQPQPQQQRYIPNLPQHVHQPPALAQPPNLHPYVGPSAVLTPHSEASSSSIGAHTESEQQDQRDEGLLIGPGFDEESRYEDEPATPATTATTATTATLVPATRGLPAQVQDAEMEPAPLEPKDAVIVVGKKAGKRRER